MFQSQAKDNQKKAQEHLYERLIGFYNDEAFNTVILEANKGLMEHPHTHKIHSLLGVVCHRNGNLGKAIYHLRESLRLDPHEVMTYNNLGAVLNDFGLYEEAKKLLKVAIKLDPNYSDAFNNLGNVLQNLQNYKASKYFYLKSIKLNPKDATLYNNLGNSLINLKKFKKAEKSFQKAINLNSLFAEAYGNSGGLLFKLKKYKKAKQILRQAIKLKPNYAEAYNNLGNIYSNQKKNNKALEFFNKAIEFKPKFFESHNDRGALFLKLGNLSQAIESFKKAIEINKNYFDANLNLASAIGETGNLTLAIEYYYRALEIDPKNANIYNAIGKVFRLKEDYQAAKESFEHAIVLKKKFAEPQINLGIILFSEGKYYEGLKLMRQAVKLVPNDAGIQGALLYALNYSPDLSAEEIYQSYQMFDQRFSIPIKSKENSRIIEKDKKKRLKIGYVSPDFRKHAMSYTLEPLFEKHDRKQFEVFAFAELNNNEDNTTKCYKKLVDHWIPTKKFSDKELAKKIRSLGIDILIDCAGHTSGNRLGAFMYKPAPVSISWYLGYGYTSGVSAIDYFLTDWNMAPKGSEHLFAEKLWRPDENATLCFRGNSNMGEEGPLPALSNGFITFGTLTRTIRLNHHVIKVWSKILKKVENSKLIINNHDLKNNKTTIIELKKNFSQCDIEEDRLDFFFESPAWRTMRQIDIALDCFPHNSGTTVLEHLYMGNPIITLAGRPSVGRIGASYLKTIGREDWVAKTEEQYIEKTVSLASNTKNLVNIRASLRKEMRKSPLMNEQLVVTKIETAYKKMWKDLVSKPRGLN